ncbi:transporter substrate-binding domain-containing protein [Bacillus sp. NPDC093026]|uniref:transporter substrate-binding domain-containing protein n=1 Tax=Bacillus sp. NPDC093026 TaxID=3363948 RepID=UPI00380E2E13
MKKSILLMMGLVVVLVMAACGSKSDSGSGEGKGTYKIGIDTTYPPFEFEKGDKYEGIDVDLINAIAKDQGFKVKLEAMDFSGIIPAMQAGQLDVGMGGMSITDERKKKVDFSEPYFDAGLTVVVKKDSSIKSIEDLKGKKLAVKNGTTGAKFATDNADKYGYDIVQFNDSPSMFQEVSNGNADALIEDYPVITYAIAQQDLNLKTVGDRLNGDQYGISVMKGKNQDLLKKINKGLENLKKNGEYEKILNKYLKS